MTLDLLTELTLLYRRNSAPLLFIIPFVVLIILLGVYLRRRTIKNVWDNFMIISDTFGMNVQRPELGYFSGLPEMSGSVKGKRLRIYTEMRGSGKSRHAHTVISFSLEGQSPDITVYREGFFSKIGKAFGMQDIRTGMQEFDEKFILRCKDEDFALKVFDQVMCDKLVEHHRSLLSGIYLRNGWFSYDERGYLDGESRRERFLLVIRLCQDLSGKIEKAQGKSTGRPVNVF